MEQLIDIGVNLTHRQFDTDREAVIERAASQGVWPLLVTGTSARESKKAADLAARYPGRLYATCGVHPHDAKTWNENTLFDLTRLAKRREVVAIGECGLDYDRDFSPREVQRDCFEKQLCLAEELSMPLFLHERSAFEDFRQILKEHPSAASHAVVHCFTGNGRELSQYLGMGCYIGITGWICDERRGGNLQSLVRMIPLERLMIETDAPFLIPRNLPSAKGVKRNEPAFLPHILLEIAKCMRKTPEEVARATTQNAKHLFGLPD